MKFLIKSLAVIIILHVYISCDTTDSPLPPDPKITLEYDWEVNNLVNPHGYGVIPWSMWGSSPTDVWAVGFNLAGQGEMFHYNGVSWQRVTPNLGFNYELLSIYGFGTTEVYAVGSEIIIDTTLRTKSLILKYNGTSWQTENIIKGSGLSFLHGYDSNNIWACGIEGALYKKDGNLWQKISFDEKYDLGPIWVAPSGYVFMMYEYYDYPITADTAMFYFSKYNSSAWNILDSCRLVNIDGIPTGYKFAERGMIGISENHIYSAGIAGLFEFNGSDNSLVYWADYYYRDIKKNNGGNVFVVGDHGTIHYSINNQWKHIGDYSRYVVDFYSIMPFENEIFIGAYSGGNGYIIHGTLKK